MNPSADFNTSYQNFDSYPTQLLYKGTYYSSLTKIKLRLDEAAPELFISDHGVAGLRVPFRDLDPSYGEPKKYNAKNDATLQSWLDLSSQLRLDIIEQRTVGQQLVRQQVSRRDPKCRFIHFCAEDSRQPLNLTKEMLARILTYHQVMPAYLEFIYIFGKQNRPKDLTYSGFREQSLIGNPAKGPAVTVLGRSGRQFQLCYNLKAPFLRKFPNEQWEIQQAAIHHQFDVVEGTAVWIVTKGDQELKERIERMTGTGLQGRPEDCNFTTTEDCLRSSLAVHLLLCSWSSEDWRWYVKSLEDSVHKENFEAIDAKRDRNRLRRKYKRDDVLIAQGYSEKTNQAIMVLENNIDIFAALRGYYEGLLEHPDFPQKGACRPNILTFAAQIKNMAYDMKMQVSRAKLLRQTVADRKSIISQHLEEQTAEVMEDLTTSMYNMGLLAQRVAIAMKIVTVVTLIYLPATFVSTFFSTDIAKYQNPNNTSTSSGSYFSSLALQRWLEVTLPLTLITLAVAAYFLRRSIKRMKQEIGVTGMLPVHEKSVWKA